MPRIGFNACAPRERYYAGGAAPSMPNDVGPGQYDTAPHKAAKPAFAAFNTSENRQQLGKDNEVPGPGAYQGLPPHAWDAMGGKNAFRSTLQRFKPPPVASTPGPGSYQTSMGGLDRYKRDAAKRRARNGAGLSRQPGSKRVEWVRVPSAPSIPTNHQSYGYEEGSHGELVMQQPVWKGYTGLGQDTVSPLDYAPKLDFTRPNITKGLNFSKYSGRSERDRKYKTLVPGHKDFGLMEPVAELEAPSEPVVKNMMNVQRKSAVFSSATHRGTLGVDEKEVRPGPGAYVLPGALQVGPRKKRAHQNFGTSAPRFETGPRARNRVYGGPGPGSYNQLRSDFDHDKRREALRSLVRNPSAPAAAFESSATRFDVHDSSADVKAAPGAYDLPDFAAELERKKKASSRTAVFGSTTKRFGSRRPHTADEEDIGAPLSVEQPHSKGHDDHDVRKAAGACLGNIGRRAGGGWVMGVVKGRDVARESAAFASETQRSAPNQSDTAPPPGAYDVSAKWETGKCAVSMARGGQRFRKVPDEYERNRGPGSYSLEPTIKTKPPNRRKEVMMSGSKRFGPEMEQFAGKAPGPGSYDVEPFYGGLVRPTFNVAIAEQCGAL